MRRAAFKPAAPPWITTRVSLFARMLIGISCLAEFGDVSIRRSGDLKFRHTTKSPNHSIVISSGVPCRRCQSVACGGRTRGYRSLRPSARAWRRALLSRAARRGAPDFHPVQLTFGLRLPESGDDAAERLFD